VPRALALLAIGVLSSALPAAAQPPGRTNANLERARTHYVRGWEYMRAESFETAVDEFREAIELHPQFALAHYGLGRAYLALRRYAEAIASLATSRDIYSAEASRKFQNQLDANRYRQDRLMELQDLRNQYSKGPQTTQSADMLRQIDNQIRLTSNVIDRELGMAIENLVPAFVSLSLGSAYFRAEQMGDAEREYKAAIRTDPKSAEAHNNLAVIYLLTNRPKEAQDEIKAAEKTGFRVNPELKEQIRMAAKAKG
jgi:tetratricopeptide (TPR) repeat protein